MKTLPQLSLLKSKNLFFHGCIIELFYLFFFLITFLKKLLGDHSLTLSDERIFAFVLILLLTNWFLFIRGWRKLKSERILGTRKIIIAFIFIFNLTLLFVPPIASNDIYSYIYEGRLVSIQKANPYSKAYDCFKQDDFYAKIHNRWSEYTTPYGPVFLSLAGGLSFIGKHSLYFSLIIFKAFFILINGVCIFLIDKLLRNESSLFLYGWNPLILFEISVNGHNDILLIFFFLVFLTIITRPLNLKNRLFSWLAIILSALVKVTGFILSPFIYIYILAQTPGAKKKIVYVLLSILFSLFLAGIFYFFFWEGKETFSRLFTQISQFETLFFASPFIIMMYFFLKIFHIYSVEISIFISRIFFLLAYTFLITHFIFVKDKTLNKLMSYCLAVFILFFFTFFTWLMPWYFSILILLTSLMVSLLPAKENKFAILNFTVSLLDIAYYYFLR